MYQLDVLRQALDALEQRVPRLKVQVDWTNGSEATAQGRIPTVTYKVEMQGREIGCAHPLPVVAAPVTLAEEIRVALNDPQDRVVKAMIQNIRDCSVSSI